jgi:hypothetical protein
MLFMSSSCIFHCRGYLRLCQSGFGNKVLWCQCEKVAGIFGSCRLRDHSGSLLMYDTSLFSSIHRRGAGLGPAIAFLTLVRPSISWP